MPDGSIELAAVERVSRTPELLEHILTFLLCDLLDLTDQEDPRSVRVHGNAAILKHLLQSSRVSRSWNVCIFGSTRLLRSLFLTADTQTNRSWDVSVSATRARLLYNYYTAPHFRAPQLNPIIQTTFAAYHFRFWHLSIEDSGGKHVAYLIINRRDMLDWTSRSQSGRGKAISNMLLSQPPPLALEATIWEERDETRDYVGRTTALGEATIECSTGVTIGCVHERVARMFNEHPDVAAIKLTTK